MLKFLFMLLISWTFLYEPAAASMPFYDDDDEWKQCVAISNDWDQCTLEETRRFLNKVKTQYRNLLLNPNLNVWNDTPEANKEMLRDMYESWTAFRNRLCSLSKSASRYIAPLKDEEYACNLYYVLHHEDHLDSVLLLLNKQPLTQDFDYLTIYEHDDDYKTCMEKVKNEDKCIDEELVRSNQDIKDFYNSFLNNEFVGKWNNGPDLKNGNYRDMFDSWVAYRNRMCSLSVAVYKYALGENAMTLNRCLQFFNREKYETMANLLMVSYSILDPDAYDDSTNDGGAAEGQKITPLKRRISTGSGQEETLSDDKETPVADKASAVQPEQPEETKQLPSWAKQR